MSWWGWLLAGFGGGVAVILISLRIVVSALRDEYCYPGSDR